MYVPKHHETKTSRLKTSRFPKGIEDRKMKSLGDITLEFPEIRCGMPKNEVQNRLSIISLRFILDELYRYQTTLRPSWGVQSPNLTTSKHSKQTFQSQIVDQQQLCFHVELRARLHIRFHGLQNIVGASSICAFWVRYCSQNKFIHSLKASPFRIFD